MHLNSAVIGIVIFILFFGPIIYAILQSANKEKKIAKTIKDLSKPQGINITNLEVIGNSVIGIDEVSKKLVLSNTKDLSANFEIIDLKTLKDCRTKSQRLKNKIVEFVELELVGQDFVKDVIFYTEDEEDTPVTDSSICLHQAEIWEKTIKSQLRVA